MWGDLRRYGERLRSLVPWGSNVGDSAEEPSGRPPQVLEQLRETITVVSFWTAISLPFLYVPVLLTGLDTRSELLALGGLILTHVVVLSLGHSHAIDASQRRPDQQNRDRTTDAGEHTPGD